MSPTCDLSPTGEHETVRFEGISGNSYFECKYCKQGEMDD